MTFNQMNIELIKPNKNNPRILRDDKFEKLKKSIQEFPEMLELREIIVDEDMVILGGNMRYKALKELGIKDVPVKIAKGLTEEQKKEFIIKDNVGFGEWDWDMLANEWDSESLDEWGLDVPEMAIEEELEAQEDDFDEALPEQPITVLGDLYEIGQHRLLCGDSTDSNTVAKLMNGNKADMVFTDPPYGVDYKSKKLGKILNDKLKGDSLYQFIYDTFSNLQYYTIEETSFYCWYEDKFRIIFQTALEDSGLEYKSNLIWNKGMDLSGADYQKAHENCLYLQKKGSKAQWFGDRDKKTVLGLRRKDFLELKKEQLIRMLLNMQDVSTVWDLDRDNVTTYAHPTQKPVTLSGRSVLNNTLTNDTILDVFLGSGSTMVASHQLKRKCYGMELDPKYCDVIVKRMLKLDPELTVRRNGQDVTNEFIS